MVRIKTSAQGVNIESYGLQNYLHNRIDLATGNRANQQFYSSQVSQYWKNIPDASIPEQKIDYNFSALYDAMVAKKQPDGRVRIASTDFVEGLQGWAIWSDGDAEFNDTIFRGSVNITEILNLATYTVATLPDPPTTVGFSPPSAYS